MILLWLVMASLVILIQTVIFQFLVNLVLTFLGLKLLTFGVSMVIVIIIDIFFKGGSK